MGNVYDDLKDNANYQIVLILDDQANKKTRTVTSVLQNDISLAGGNDFTTAGDILRDFPIAGKALQIKDKATASSKALGKSIVTQFETSLVWSNSLKPVLNVEMTFYQDSLSTQKDILEDYLAIKAAVLPSAQGEFYKSPLGFKIGDLKKRTLKQQGMVSIQIGKWFKMVNAVIVSESFTFSKEVNREGKPLFITGSVSLEPSKAITYSQFQKYFINTRRV